MSGVSSSPHRGGLFTYSQFLFTSFLDSFIEKDLFEGCTATEVPTSYLQKENFVKEFTVGINPWFTSRYVRKAWRGTSIFASRRPVVEHRRFLANRSRRFYIPLPANELWMMKLSTRYWSKLKIFWTIDRLPQSGTTHKTYRCGVDTGNVSHQNAGLFTTCWCFHRSGWLSSFMAISAIAWWLLLEKTGEGVSSSTPTSSEVLKTLQKSSETNTKRADWPKALVSDTFADRNNIVRRVRVRTASFSFLHDVRKLLFRDHWSMSCPVYLFSLLAFV